MQFIMQQALLKLLFIYFSFRFSLSACLTHIQRLSLREFPLSGITYSIIYDDKVRLLCHANQGR